MAVPFSNTTLRVPHGFPNLLEGFAREVLRKQPKDIHSFGATYFEELLRKREETKTEDVAQIGAKLDDRYYNSKAFYSGACSINNPEHQEAAVRIQAEYRRHLASQETEHLREEDAAIKIQAGYRGYRDRKLVHIMKGEEPDMDYYIRKQIKKEEDEEEYHLAQLTKSGKYTKDEAAAIIQSRYRDHLLQRERRHSVAKIKHILLNNDDDNDDDDARVKDEALDPITSSLLLSSASSCPLNSIQSSLIDSEEKSYQGEDISLNEKTEEIFNLIVGEDEIGGLAEEQEQEQQHEVEAQPEAEAQQEDEEEEEEEVKNLELIKQEPEENFIEEPIENIKAEDLNSLEEQTGEKTPIKEEEQTSEKTPIKEDEEIDVKPSQNSDAEG
ncbi:unnamed protein product [Schistosoma turkestanicum]|nr:unnamed protein product [Schistosoma turkestanicum]